MLKARREKVQKDELHIRKQLEREEIEGRKLKDLGEDLVRRQHELEEKSQELRVMQAELKKKEAK